MKVCVVGGNGNIGYYVAQSLLSLGHEVVCFNRGLTGPIPDGARHLRGDRYERADFERKIQSEKFDAAIDMTSMNREDALSSVRAFRDAAHFINCSSVATYGREFDWFPTTEDHPLRPWTDSDYAVRKADADAVFEEALRKERFPVTFIRPSITYGHKLGLIRQIGNDLVWIDRIRKGLPIVISGDGQALHQFMHVQDAGRAFALVVGRKNCIGEIFNLVHPQVTSWDTYHKTVIRVVGREDVEMVGVPATELKALRAAGCIHFSDVFAENCFFSGEKFHNAVPEFKPEVSLEAGVRQVLERLDRDGHIPIAEENGWEDKLIEAQRNLRGQLV